jgi:NAD dependent epimerase/dehydratase family enzyme
MLPGIRDDAIDAMLGLTQGNMSCADYTHLFKDFLRRSRQHLTNNLQCVRFIK